jgi:hypothetical protein
MEANTEPATRKKKSDYSEQSKMKQERRPEQIGAAYSSKHQPAFIAARLANSNHHLEA